MHEGRCTPFQRDQSPVRSDPAHRDELPRGERKEDEEDVRESERRNERDGEQNLQNPHGCTHGAAGSR
jgi:hypothetical protein